MKPLYLVLLAALLAATGCDRGSHPRQLGKAAPDFTLTDAAHTVHLEAYRGHIVVLNFWATWCKPCIAELPSLMAMQKELPGVQVIAVSTDEDPAAYRQFLIDNKITLLTVNDPSHRSSDLYGTYRWPETYIIDRNGAIRRKFIGPQDWTSPEILEYLRRL